MAQVLHEKHRYRLVLCGHKAVEAGAVCLLLMVQGDIAGLTLGHLGVAGKTGLLAIFPALGVTFTRHGRYLANRWVASGLLGITTFAADVVVHQSHYPGFYTEAALTGLGAFVFSLVVSFTPIGKRIDALAEAFIEGQHLESKLPAVGHKSLRSPARKRPAT
jgi:hypothetical protein